jgi:hypothetical protein
MAMASSAPVAGEIPGSAFDEVFMAARIVFLALFPFFAACDVRAELPDAANKSASECTIRIDFNRSGGRISRYLTGACIEDVNHEIYGGLYSQMIFGESFQEAPLHQPIAKFLAYAGTWSLHDEELHAGGGQGPKLISDHSPVTTGTVAVEVFFPKRAAGNAGLIVKTNKAGRGADRFDGYEISLNPVAQVLTLGRHRQNWEPIKDTPCTVPLGKWVRLVVRMGEQSLEVQVDGEKIVSYEDREHPLKSGGIGLRQWQLEARYRNLTVQTSERVEPIPFRANPDEAGPVSGMWKPLRRGQAIARYTLETTDPFTGKQSQGMDYVKGEGEVGIENQGLNRWGLAFSAGKEYEGYLQIRAERPVELFARLESRDGNIHAETKLAVGGNGWQRVNFRLKPNADDAGGQFTLILKKPGSVELGHVFLQPGEWGRFKQLPLRRDVVEGMIDQGITILRYGGSMVNAPEYRWKKMIGPRDRRPPYAGTWYPYSTNGWGIVDFLDLCEAADFTAIPAFNMDETPQDMADFVRYVNGAVESDWGKKRAADGHPASYRLKHLELGNEERVDEKYWQRFRTIAEAVWQVDPEIVLVVGDFAYGRPIADPDHIKGAASGITDFGAHRKILELARRHGREVWFDVHIGTEHPGALGELEIVPMYVAALNKVSGGAKHQVAVFELNAGNHAQRRALANAIALGSLQKLGKRIAVVCSANGLQPDGQNDNGWDQGLLFLNTSQVWLQPPGYVTRMIARSYQPIDVSAEVRGQATALKVAADRSEDGKKLVLRVVNAEDKPTTATLDLSQFQRVKPGATVVELVGRPDAQNTAADRNRVVPKSRMWQPEGPRPAYTFPPNSFTVLTFE